MVHRVVEDVRDVEKQGAVGLFTDSAEEFCFGQGAERNGKRVGDILKSKRPPNRSARRIVILLHPLRRFLFKRNCEEHREIIPIDAVIGEVFAENIQPMFFHEAFRASKVGIVGRSDGPNGERQPMSDTRKCRESITKQTLIGGAVDPALADEVVFRGKLEQIDFIAMLHRFAMNAESVGQPNAVGVFVQGIDLHGEIGQGCNRVRSTR